MKPRSIFILGFAVFACAASPGSPAAQQGSQGKPQGSQGSQQGVEIAWNRFYDTDEINGLLRKIATAHPDLCSIQSIGKSFQGRDMWVLTIQNPKIGKEMEKPAMWVDGNVHGNEVQGARRAYTRLGT